MKKARFDSSARTKPPGRDDGWSVYDEILITGITIIQMHPNAPNETDQKPFDSLKLGSQAAYALQECVETEPNPGPTRA